MSSRPARRAIALGLIAAVAVALGVFGAHVRKVDLAFVPPPSSTRPQPSVAISTTRVVGIGDSVMSGTACGCEGIPTVYGRKLIAKSRAQMSAVNLGKDGSTADSTEADLKDGTIDRDVVGAADVLLIIVGANDLGPADDQYEAGGCSATCFQPLVRAMGQHLAALLADVRQLAGPHAQILVGTYWNVFPDGEPSIVPGGAAELAWSRALTVDTNQTICRAAAPSSARCVDLATPFFGAAGSAPLLADDGDHPNGPGVAAIAAQLVDATDVRALQRP